MEAERLPETVCNFLLRQSAETPHLPACAISTSAGNWNAITWQDHLSNVRRTAAVLQHLGLKPSDRLAIVGSPIYEWQQFEFACLFAGAVVVGIDPRSSPEQIERILAHCQPRGLVVLDSHVPERVRPELLSRLHFAITLPEDHKDERFIAWANALSQHDKAVLSHVDVEPASPATIVYTSGTTGTPKGIEFTHQQVMAACRAIARELPQLGAGDRTLVWLPLAHLFQRVMSLVFLSRGMTLYFVPDPREIVTAARQVKPAALIGVPRFYEKLVEGMQSEVSKLPRFLRQLANWGLTEAAKTGSLRRQGQSLTVGMRARHAIADAAVLRRLRSSLGGRIKYLFSGSAPLPTNVIEFLDDIGWTLLEAYGVSENAIPMASNRPNCIRLGSVGRPFAENDIRLADDGEILVRGPGVMHGYYRETSEDACDVFTADGYYRTGDLGRFDADGFLYLCGRKNDSFKTSTGRKIVPHSIEAVYQQSPLIEQVVVFGAGRPYLVALLAVNEQELRSRIANDNLWEAADRGEPRLCHAAQTILRDEIDNLGQSLPGHERIRDFVVLRKPLSAEAEELTLTLKVRRKNVEQKYGAELARLYESKAVSP